jgi:murein DD-endopeptidase MepM/ murein hydrolase activator NlpD
MQILRDARRARGLTIVALAQKSRLPARTLGMLEQGALDLDPTLAAQLAQALEIPISVLLDPQPLPGARALPWRVAALSVLAVAIGLTWSLVLSLSSAPATPARAAARRQTDLYISAFMPPAQLILPTATHAPGGATATPQLGPTATRAANLAAAPTPPADGAPRACPLLADPQRVVITQGYGEGTHVPINVAGAIDLAIDSDGDGAAEPGATSGIVVLASHSGKARVWLGSWPGGNVVRVIDEQSGWNTLYAHLDQVAVTDGQPITVGMPLGTVGSTGMSTGPHLHYEIWHFGENKDPTDMAPCWRR